MTEPLILMADVVFRYQAMTMRFDLRVERGEILAIIGPSGAGKSTLQALIGGFEPPASGLIEIAGADMAGVPASRRPVTSLFQDNNLFAHLDVAQNVGLGIAPRLALSDEEMGRVAAALARVGIAGFERRRPAELSGGERQRAALARCLVRRRPVLLLDEPFAALGPALRREMLDLVVALAREESLTVLLVTHAPEDARHAATHTAFVHDGRIIAKRPTAELFAATDLPELRRYLGA